MVDAGELDESRMSYSFGQVPAPAYVDASVARTMKDKRRNVNCRQNVPNIDLEVHLQHCPGRGRAGAESQVLAPPSLEPIVIRHAWGPYLNLGRPTPISLHSVEAVAELFDAGRPRIVGAPHP